MASLLFIGIGMIKDYPIHHNSIEYADFESKIPQKQYGAGTVTIWDWGGLVVEYHRGRLVYLFTTLCSLWLLDEIFGSVCSS